MKEAPPDKEGLLCLYFKQNFLRPVIYLLLEPMLTYDAYR